MESTEINSNIVLEDLYNTGRLNLYTSLAEYLHNLMHGEHKDFLVDKLRFFENLSKLVDEVKKESVSEETVSRLKATNCLKISDIEKEAYVKNLIKFYWKHGYEIETSLPPDHIVTQLSFLCELIRDMSDKDLEEKKRLLKIQNRFINVHILRWIEECDLENPLIDLIKVILKNDSNLITSYFEEESRKERNR